MITFSYARRRRHITFDENPFKYGYKFEGGGYIQDTPKLFVGRSVRVIGVKEGETPHAFTIGSIVVCTEIMSDRSDIAHARFEGSDQDTLFKEEYELI